MQDILFQDCVRFRGQTHHLQTLYHSYWQQARSLFSANISIIEQTMLQDLQQSEAALSLQQFQQSSTSTQQQIFAQPQMVCWINQLDRLVTKKPLSPEDLQAHLSAFARFTTSSLIMDHREGSTLLPFDAAGYCVLPGYGLLLDKGKDFANRILRCQITTEGLSIANTDGSKALFCTFDQFESDTELPAWLHRIVECRGISVYNEDPFLLESDGANYTYDHIYQSANRVNQEKWKSVLESSLSYIEEVLPAGYKEIMDHIRVIIPVVPPKPGAHTSGTNAFLPGAIYLSLSDDPLMIAESLTHEYGHNKLNVMLKTDPLITNALLGPQIYSPWKSVHRPLLGILHGIFAFQGVCQLWQAVLAIPSPNVKRDLVMQRFYTFFRQIQIACIDLRKAAHFTTAGEAFMAQVETLITEFAQSVAGIDAEVRGSIDQQLAEHEQRYRIAPH